MEYFRRIWLAILGKDLHKPEVQTKEITVHIMDFNARTVTKDERGVLMSCPRACEIIADELERMGQREVQDMMHSKDFEEIIKTRAKINAYFNASSIVKKLVKP